MTLGLQVESRNIVVGGENKRIEIPPDYQSPQVLKLCVRSELDALKRDPVRRDATLDEELRDQGMFTPLRKPLHQRLPVNIFDPRVAATVAAVFLVANH